MVSSNDYYDYLHVDSLLLLSPLTVNTSDASHASPIDAGTTVGISQTSCKNKYGTTNFLDRAQILNVIQETHQQLHKNIQTDPKSMKFERFGQALLEKALESNKFLITVQVGAMDGISNDPLWEMFVGHPRRPSKFNKPLSHWIPIAIEPVPANFANLQKNYQTLKDDKELPCSLLMQGAISYDHSITQKTCPFCRFDVDSKLEKCTKKPDWKRYQLGTLDCHYSRDYFGPDFNDCIIQDPLPCKPIDEIMMDWQIPMRAIAMLQIDIEGYESILLPKLLQTTVLQDLPPLIHFEHKVMAHLDSKYKNTTRKDDTIKIMQEYGYTLFDQGEDYLALLLS
jgi:hypothetical protein